MNRMPIKTALSSLKWAVGHIKEEAKFGFLFLVFFLFLQGLLPSANLYILKILTNAFEVSASFSSITWILAGWAGLVLFESVLAPLVQLIRIKVNEQVHAHFSLCLMEKANRFVGLVPFENQDWQNEIAVLKEETKSKPLNLMYTLTDGVRGVIAIGAVLMFLSSMSLWLPLVMIVTVLPQVVFAFMSEQKVWDYALFHSEDVRKMNRITSLALEDSVAKEVRVYAFGSYLVEKFRQIASRFYQNMATLRRRQYLASLPKALLMVMGQIIAIGWVAWGVRQGTISLGGGIVILPSLHFLQREVLVFIQDMSMLSATTSYFQTFKKFIERQEQLGDTGRALPFHPPLESIELRNVSFAYKKGAHSILNNISISFRGGEKVAIVGMNGCGKSTLIKLLCRFYDPNEGSILVNGIDLRMIDPVAWRKQLSAIFQDFAPYPLTLRENVGIARPSVMEDRRAIVQALEKGGLGHLNLPNGLDTSVGKEFSGVELSLGELQRLAISRILCADAPVVILDEPTASLDPTGEHEIFGQLLAACRYKTVFVVSHRLNAARQCDTIVVLKAGKIMETGSHAELMSLKGEYYRLFSLQSSGYQLEEEVKEVSLPTFA